MFAAALLLAANLLVPVLWGDVYPFTSSPMFRDAPTQYCSYKVLSLDGRELPSSDWLLQRIYDGNPVGYGVGLRPPPVLEQQFGIIHDEATVRDHVQRQFAKSQNSHHQFVDIIQETIGPVDAQRVRVVSAEVWRVYQR
jgi:hypothetical protein